MWQGQTWDRRLSNLPNLTTGPFDYVPSSLEKSGCNIRDLSPLDRHPHSDGEGDSALAIQPRLQEISGNKPRYIIADSIVSNIALITTPQTESLVSTSPGPATTSNQEQEPVERSAGGESYPPSALDSASLSTVGPRTSQASGLLSIITLPSFIVNDRPRPYSSSAGAQIESPIRPNNYHRKRYSIFGQRLSGTESIPPISPAISEDTGGKRSRPTSSSLQIITSVLKRSGSTASSVRSHSPSSRRSSRRSLGRLNLTPASDDEAAIQWKRLPPLPHAQGIRTTQPPESNTAGRVEEFSTERLPSFRENEFGSPIFLAAHIPLPPSPSTLASSVSSLSYAPPSPQEIPPINGFTTPYASLYPPLPPSIPPTPNSTDKFVGSYTVRRADRTVSPATSTPRNLPSELGETQSNLDTPTTPTALISVSPKNNNDFLPYGLNDDSTVYRMSASAYSQHSSIREFVLPSPSLLGARLSPPPPMSPRGLRPLPPTPGKLSRSVTLYSQTSFTGQ